MLALVVLLWLLWAVPVHAQLALVKQESTPQVFAGVQTNVRLLLQNPTDRLVEQNVRFRLFQLSSATRLPLGEPQPWKKLRVLPGQTIVEPFPFTAPEIRAPTAFEVELNAVGRFTVLAYPPDLLKRLTTLAGDQPLGVFDPDNHLRFLLKKLHIEFADFETQLATCKLGILWPTDRKLPESVTTRVQKGMAAVWVRNQKAAAGYVTHQGAGTLVVMRADSVQHLESAPESQLNLLRFAELAVNPDERNEP